jgi:hypothetical protein
MNLAQVIYSIGFIQGALTFGIVMLLWAIFETWKRNKKKTG